jgi:hypothetical protein
MGVIVAIVGIWRSTRMARDIGFVRGCGLDDEMEEMPESEEETK